MMREYSRRSEKEVFSEDELEELAEVRAEGEEKIVCSEIVFGELREFCVDVGVFVLWEVAEVEVETVNNIM